MWSRLVITGGDHHRLHEEITISGGELKHFGYSRIPQIGRLQGLLDKAVAIEPNADLLEILTERFEKQEDSIRAAINARSKDRLRFLENTLVRRRDSEIADLMNILSELERNVRNELKVDALPKQMALPGFDSEERNQIRKDIEALRLRLERIPEEKKLEKAAIEKRYAGLTDRTFPVAVVFLVPDSHMGEVIS
ncbi:MAG: hypothetical protein HN345_10115 [Planctomycetaceae bacterium]|nr:hypothetical protein [Planctomycetaceae bacterium]